jgi:hypothetical protein
MRIDIGLDADLFDPGLVLVFLGFPLFFFLIILELAEIDDPANRRRCSGSNLYQV